MSSDRGRSWRPEKKVTARQSRRKQIIALCVLLILLVGVAGYLSLGPAVPLVQFVVVAEESFSSDSTYVTQLPPGSTAVNAVRLLKVAERLHKRESRQVDKPVRYGSVAALVDEIPDAGKKLLIVYLTAAATVAPADAKDGQINVQLLPADEEKNPVPFTKLLTTLRQSGSKRTLLLLELTGRNPELASGVLADDFRGLIESELRAQSIPGLTVICAYGKDERSWEFFQDKPAISSESSDSTVAENVAASPPTFPEFDGTVFGHYLISALEEGKAGNAATLAEYLRKEVKEWVASHYASSQTVWIASSGDKSEQSKLLTSIKLPKEPDEVKDRNEADVAASETESQKTDESKTGLSSGASGSQAQTTAIDDRPVTLLQLITEERDRLAAGTTPVRFPGEWLKLQMHMVAAERFALNGNQTEFRRIHDEVLKKSLNKLNDPLNIESTNEHRTILEWLLLSQDEVVTGGQFGPILQEFGVEPGKTPPLPKELQSSGPARRFFAKELGKELASLRQAIDTMPPPDRIKRIQQLVLLLENISEKGWRLHEFSESMATVKEVLQTWEQDPDALRLRPLVRLLAMRQSALQLAAGYGSDKRQLRQATWDSAEVAKRLDDILIGLNSAERWLCAGPDAVALADDQLDRAEKLLDALRNEVNVSQELSQVQDAQRLEVPFLIEYLALLQESSSLPDAELKSALRMAESSPEGTLKLDEDFPIGQLEPIGFSRNHLIAMFELTRMFSRDNRVSLNDKLHLDRLREFVNNRSKQSLTAAERLQLLNVPQFSERSDLLSLMQKEPANGIEATSDPSRRSGIWLSFWSLRLVDAISGQVQEADWKKWSSLVSAIDDSTNSSVAAARTEMAIALQKRWSAVIETLNADNAADVFVSQKDVLELLSREVSRRTQTSVNKNLFSSISETTGTNANSRNVPSLNVSREVTPSPNGTFEIPVGVQNVSGLYVLIESFTVLNTEKQSRHGWSVLPVDAAKGSEQTVTLSLQSNSSLGSDVSLALIGVNSDGTAVVTKEVRLQPSSMNEWQLEVVQVEEGKTTERPITLTEGKTHSENILPLPPSTIDDAKKVHAPVLVKVRLHRKSGVATKVQVQIRPTDPQKSTWAKMELIFPDGESQVTVPINAPATIGDASAAASLPAAVTIPEIDISDGIVFEVTPLDLPQKVTSSLTLYPRLHSPERIFEIPEPTYNHDTGELTLRLDRRALDNSTVIWPTQFPGEVSVNPVLNKYLKSGSSLTALNADGFTFRAQFRQELEKEIGSGAHEFGVSLAGIPHAWWWKLTDSTRPERVRGLRSFLIVENDKEIIPVAEVPALLIGEGWRKANLRPTVFLHEIRFDQEQYLSMRFDTAGSDGSTLATGHPIPINSRFAESVTVAPGEGGVWKVSTTTKPYGIPAFTPETFRLKDGRHELVASLRSSVDSSAPIESSVAFTLDESPPTVDGNSIELKSSPTLVTGSLKGRITVSDPESGVTRIRVGLKDDLMQELKFEPETKVVEDFEMDSLGFPKIEQKESRNEDYGTLTVEVFNGVGLSKKQTKKVTFFRPGKAAVMKEEPKAPGSIKVTFGSSAEFVVTVSGPEGYADEKAGPSPVVFDNVPPGACSVKWKPKQGTAGSGADSAVVVRSGKTTTIKGN